MGSIENQETPDNSPEILAPAGDANCFLAALAAGANGIYAGLKNFSARMQAQNFALGELAQLVALAHETDCKVYVAMNNLVKQPELKQACRLLERLAQQVKPDGLIIQDPGMLNLSRQAGFNGAIVLSTLANITSPNALIAAQKLGAARVVLPRELSVDEMRMIGENCPQGMELECFVQGALCYCVSGRCYWSSYMGGNSGLRGRCLQPCRRVYQRNAQGRATRASGERFFSCQDLELAPALKPLLSIRNLVSWKIEGRKKGPHYVFHTVTAYKLLRDHPNDPQARKMALELLQMALGRPGVRGRFLPQKKYQPMAPGRQTSSGMLAGKTAIQQNGACILRPHIDLLANDLLRIGVQDEKWHALVPLTRPVPKAGIMPLKLPKHKTPKAGTPVYLIDRREPQLSGILEDWRHKLEQIPRISISDAQTVPVISRKDKPRACVPDMQVEAALAPGRPRFQTRLSKQAITGVWLGPGAAKCSRPMLRKTAIWLPPAIWPEDEQKTGNLISAIWRAGARTFVCNAPWQRAFFPETLPNDALLVAGPFCNLANSLALGEMASMGFAAAFISPELPKKEILELPRLSPLPLGIVLGGFLPIGFSRFGVAGLNAGECFRSPRGEIFWTRDRSGLTWIFPAWPLDLGEKRKTLEQAGYSFFAWLNETPPQGMPREERPGLFNWNGQLL